MNKNIISFDALWESMLKCKKGVQWKDSVAHYVQNAFYETMKLEQELIEETYMERPHKEFTIHEPKQRDIISISFRDRIYQRLLNDNLIYLQCTRSFIYDNCACQKGKGTDFARKRLKTHLREYYRKYGNTGYALQIDIHGYYPNMPHDKALECYAKYLDPETFQLVQIILQKFKGDVGYNPGSQIIQILGITYLDEIDHYIKENLHIRHYIRYMDDSILISNNKKELIYCKDAIEILLRNLGLEFNPTKTRIFNLEKGILFLGFDFHISDTGKVYMTLCEDNVKKEKKKLKKLVSLAKEGLLSSEKVNQSYQAWRANASKGQNHNLILHMDQYYVSLWGS